MLNEIEFRKVNESVYKELMKMPSWRCYLEGIKVGKQLEQIKQKGEYVE